MAKAPSRQAVALWRHEMIQEALAATSREERHQIVERISRTPVRWPSGETRPISVATLYRWIKAHGESRFDGLLPSPRADKGTRRVPLPKCVVEKAFAIFAEDPELTLTLILEVVRTDPEVVAALAARGARLTRSTLQRRLAEEPRYVRLRRAVKRQRPRRRFVPRRPHVIWHMDAKGPEKIRLTSGKELSFRVLSILDGASRAVLAALIVPEEDTRAAVRVFRLAARRYGLPSRIYLDRGSPYDSRLFRNGLAVVGVNRIFVKPRNAPPNGKIEAYHRTLELWFFRPLRKQAVIDVVHLQQLLDGVIHFYQRHHHRDLGKSPEEALGGLVSSRAVSAERLREAFLESRLLKTHRTTGEVRIPRGHGMYLVPRDDLRGRRLEFLIDPDTEVVPLVVDPESSRRLPLVRAAVRPEDAEEEAPRERWGHGVLQCLYDNWHGKVRPVAEPGFGLPEVFDLLAEVVGRPVPATDAEAARIHKVYATLGPLPRAATEEALRAICADLGPGRPLQVYLEALARRVLPSAPPKSSRPSKSSRSSKPSPPSKERRSRT